MGRYDESGIQIAFMQWFRYQYPQYARVCFHVPNEGQRTTKVVYDRRSGTSRVVSTGGARMKAEGMVAGVADIILLIPRKGYGSLCIEFKTPTGRQSAEQVRWQEEAERVGNKYILVRSVEEAIGEVNEYLSSI